MAKTNHKRIEELQALGRLLADPAGRRWIWGILGECHIWQTSMASNALKLSFLEGERNQGLRLLSEIQEANAEMFLQMMRENQSVRRDSNYAPGRDYDPTGLDESGVDASAGDYDTGFE